MLLLLLLLGWKYSTRKSKKDYQRRRITDRYDTSTTIVDKEDTKDGRRNLFFAGGLGFVYLSLVFMDIQDESSFFFLLDFPSKQKRRDRMYCRFVLYFSLPA